MIKRAVVVLGMISVLGSLSCGLFDEVEQRLNVLTVAFSYDSTNVGFMAPAPTDILGLMDPAKYGVIFNCLIGAENSNDKDAVFDGATFYLRIQETSNSAQAFASPINSFTVKAASSTTLNIPFLVTLDNPLFSGEVYQKIVNGDKIPYRVNADLLFNLVTPKVSGGLDTLGSKTVKLDLVTDSIPTRVDKTSPEAQLFMSFAGELF